MRQVEDSINESMTGRNLTGKNPALLEDLMDKKLKMFEEKIDKVVTSKLSSACENLQQNIKETNKTIVEIPEKMNQSFKSVLTKNIPNTPSPNLKQVILEERNNQLVQDRERKRRATNVIIHGVKEDSENITKSDEKYVKELMTVLGVDNYPESVVRLGNVDSDRKRSRPLRLAFRNEDEKNSIMKRLSNLKKAEEQFNKISITDDYTLEERQEIKKYVEEAQKKNKTETGNFYWRVRGSPKTGLELRKVPKKVSN